MSEARVLTENPGILTRTEFDQQTRERISDDGPGENYGGWYCVSTRPFPCPAEGCEFTALHMTAAHLILVWPESDDPAMLGFASDAKKFGRDPHIVEWESPFGPALSYYRWTRIGRPVHGMLDPPAGWPERRNRHE